ncbi:hypothetical protein U1Q18_024781 [Sarracenia purpurea var. burkii]
MLQIASPGCRRRWRHTIHRGGHRADEATRLSVAGAVAPLLHPSGDPPYPGGSTLPGHRWSRSAKVEKWRRMTRPSRDEAFPRPTAAVQHLKREHQNCRSGS